ncbi:MAG: Ig-like domain-containing protein, partial [Afipia sp.]|nr:Ig-like domain-containing protein [Afipia sp.]
AADGDKQLMLELADSDRMNRANYVKTVWDPANAVFKKVVTNYPLGMPAATDYMGTAIQVAEGTANVNEAYGLPADYPWFAPGSGYGLPVSGGKVPDGVAACPQGTNTRAQVIGVAVYRKAAQLSQEYSQMVTGEGGTRGKFTECCMDVKYDAWVIESLSHGILPIIDVKANTGEYSIPVRVLEDEEPTPAVTGITADPATLSIQVGEQGNPIVQITGTGKYDKRFTAMSSNADVASVNDRGVITGVSAGSATITYRSVGDTQQTTTVAVTVTARA